MSYRIGIANGQKKYIYCQRMEKSLRIEIQQKHTVNTRNIFKDNELQEEIYETSEILKSLSYVRRHLKSYFNNGKHWENEYVSINRPYHDGIQSLKSDDDFIIKHYHKSGFLYYKIFPKEVSSFLKKYKHFDGCLTYDSFIDNDTDPNIILDHQDNLYAAVLYAKI